jgi:hypothetical protein
MPFGASLEDADLQFGNGRKLVLGVGWRRASSLP